MQVWPVELATLLDLIHPGEVEMAETGRFTKIANVALSFFAVVVTVDGAFLLFCRRIGPRLPILLLL